MEYTPSFRDRLYADVIPSFSHAITNDQKYGIPELNKFPMPDANHVRSAIKFFNYVTPAYEQQLASAILNRIQEYGISIDSLNVGDENRFKKYLIAATELKHHGITGQKWGVRRYQNPDGSLTPRGQKRYNKNKQYLDRIRADEDRTIKNNRDYLDQYSKATDSIDNSGRDYLRKEGFDDNTIDRAVAVTKAQRKRYQAMGEDVLKHQIDMNKKISDIDPGAQSYRKTKKLVKDIMKEAVAYEQNAHNAYLNSPEYLEYRKGRYGY